MPTTLSAGRPSPAATVRSGTVRGADSDQHQKDVMVTPLAILSAASLLALAALLAQHSAATFASNYNSWSSSGLFHDFSHLMTFTLGVYGCHLATTAPAAGNTGRWQPLDEEDSEEDTAQSRLLGMIRVPLFLL